jgi:hypothetical protein
VEQATNSQHTAVHSRRGYCNVAVVDDLLVYGERYVGDSVRVRRLLTGQLLHALSGTVQLTNMMPVPGQPHLLVCICWLGVPHSTLEQVLS